VNAEPFNPGIYYLAISEMATEEGIIEKILPRKAMVRIRKGSHCVSCGSRDACQILNDEEMLIEVANELQAKAGDHVEINVPTRALLKLSLIVYFLPVAALIIGAYAGGALAQSFHVQSNLASIMAGGFAMVIAFCVLKRLDRTAQASGEYYPRITRILVQTPLKPTIADKAAL